MSERMRASERFYCESYHSEIEVYAQPNDSGWYLVISSVPEQYCNKEPKRIGLGIIKDLQQYYDFVDSLRNLKTLT